HHYLAQKRSPEGFAVEFTIRTNHYQLLLHEKGFWPLARALKAGTGETGKHYRPVPSNARCSCSVAGAGSGQRGAGAKRYRLRPSSSLIARWPQLLEQGDKETRRERTKGYRLRP